MDEYIKEGYIGFCRVMQLVIVSELTIGARIISRKVKVAS